MLVDSPLLSYIDVRHPHFLPSNLTISEARDLNPRYITTEDLAPMGDASAEQASQNRRVHEPVEKPDDPVEVAEPAATEPVNFSEVDSDQGEDMVTR